MKMMGCKKRREKKQKRSLLSLQELLCKDADELGKVKDGEREKDQKKEDDSEDDEFAAFLKKQLEAKKRKKTQAGESKKVLEEPEVEKQSKKDEPSQKAMTVMIDTT